MRFAVSKLAAAAVFAASMLAPAFLATAYADPTVEELNFRSGPASGVDGGHGGRNGYLDEFR